MEKIIKRPEGSYKKKKVLGRGYSNGKGGKAARGDNGAKSRSGYRRKYGFEGGQMPLIRRMPKRGFSNYPFKKNYEVVNLHTLEKKYNESETVNNDTLKKKNIIKKKEANIKILGSGELNKKLTIGKELSLSKSAKDKIVSAGGTIETPDEDKKENKKSKEEIKS